VKNMLFHIDPSASVPIYVQVVDQVKSATASGLLQAGEQLPSVRELALSLTVNPNTISRAYQELEREGLIVTQRGRGTFVAETEQRLTKQARLKMLEQAIDRLLVDAYHLRITKAELLQLIEERSRLNGEGRSDGASDHH
jgi:GntR family transcriptional regulator